MIETIKHKNRGSPFDPKCHIDGSFCKLVYSEINKKCLSSNIDIRIYYAPPSRGGALEKIVETTCDKIIQRNVDKV